MGTEPQVTGLTVVSGLATPHLTDGDTPRIERLASGTGATVVRISFAEGQTMEDHRSAAPILVQVTAGEIDFEVSGETVTLTPGTAIHLEGGITHRLVAKRESVVALVVLR